MPLIRELSEKMKQKRSSLIQAARELFIENGIYNTSVDAIVQRAKVAKGTFYLYFKDKESLMSEIVYDINRALLLKAFNTAKENENMSYTDRFILMIDNIINHFIDNPQELTLVKKNFSWPLIKERITEADKDTELLEAMKTLVKHQHMDKYSDEEAKNIIFATVEMCGALCYSCVINKQPTDMDAMKPTLYMMIRKILA